jgi:DNA-directed RNA polymerase sigma subunit (sigma70/sigma32)
MKTSVRRAVLPPSVAAAPSLGALEREVERAFRDLPTPELRVVRLRFGIGARRCSVPEVARRLDLAVSAVRRLERRALRTLRVLALPPDEVPVTNRATNTPAA